MRHLMSKNFSAPRSEPNPASVTTMSASASAERVARMLLQPCAMLPNGPACTNAGPPSSVCTRFGRIASLSSSAIAPVALQLAGGHRARVAPAVEPTMIRAEPLLEILRTRRQRDDRHDLAGRDDDEALLARRCRRRRRRGR